MKASDDQLREAFASHRALPFPPDSETSDELSNLHAELVDYDGFVAGLVSSLLGGVAVDESRLKHDRALRVALERTAETPSEPERSEARAYLAYYRSLERLLDLAGAKE
jgi:hypothetical protein